MYQRLRQLEKRPFVRKVIRATGSRLPFFVGRALNKLGVPKLALPVLAVARRNNPDKPQIAWAQMRACLAMGDAHKADAYRAERLRLLMAPHIAAKNYVGLLENMAELERTGRAAPFAAGRLIAHLLVTEKGRKTLLSAATKANKRFRESVFLVHLISICRGMQGDYRRASTLLIDAIDKPYAGDEKLRGQRMQTLQQSWRVLDLLAREQMDWTEDTPQAASTPGQMPAQTVAKAAVPQEDTQEGLSQILDTDQQPAKVRASFKERALQSRQREEYLRICDAELAQADKILAQINILISMLRTGIRHIPDYTGSYAHADRQLRAYEGRFDVLFEPAQVETVKQAEQTVLELCAYMSLAAQLGRDDLTARITQYLLDLSRRPELAHALWPAPGTLVHSTKNERDATRIMGVVAENLPRINRDMQHYFRWASLTRNYQAANLFYDALPAGLRRGHGLLHYVNILQRQGRFGQALRLLQEVHGQSLANPSRANAFTNHSLIKRTGELRFLIETGRLYKSVPQPTNPKGIIMIAPRNIDQLRRYPLMALLEFKRQGWAVMPLVEGLLPRELTGFKDIDAINGAVSPVAKLVDRAEAVMPPLEDFNARLDEGHLSWGNIDLSHSVWEDAAINRRRYTINYACPELQRYLGGLSNWTQAMARVVNYAHGLHEKRGLKVGLMSLFNSRLPDSLFRFYCAENGDADTFFSLHAANGYQNYFTNFSTNISQRLVLRNMTRHGQARSASFPLPDNFKRYYKQRKPELAQITERFAPITKVRRSTEGATDLPAQAQALDARIAQWRAQGGKVACAFGKVVCDSSVPFDGGPAHANMKDWLNHSIRAVQGTNTLLLIKPHPHELNNQIATFPTEYFKDLIEEPLGDNAVFMGHRWFDMDDMRHRIDMGLVYNGTTTVELGLMGIPCITAGHFAPIDYPIGQIAVKTRKEYESYLSGKKQLKPVADLRERAAVWLDYMANDRFTQPYRFHARPVTNKVVYPPYWFQEDLATHAEQPNPALGELVGRALGTRFEPGHAKFDRTAPQDARFAFKGAD